MNKQKNTNTQNDGTTITTTDSPTPPLKTWGGGRYSEQRTDHHIRACSASVSTHLDNWNAHTHTRLVRHGPPCRCEQFVTSQQKKTTMKRHLITTKTTSGCALVRALKCEL